MTPSLRETVRQNPNKMTMQLARELGVPEVEVIRALPEERVTELDASRWEEILRALEPAGPVRVLVSNSATTIEAFGAFGGFSTTGEFFNVQTDSLDMHIRWPELAAFFAVLKPSHMNGRTTHSIQCFDREGRAAFKVFLSFGSEITPEHRELFEELVASFRLSSTRKSSSQPS